MRELTNTEMKAIIKAAENALPEDARPMGIVIIFSADAKQGLWVNRISNIPKKLAEGVIEFWMKAMETRKNFGTPNQN